MFEMVKAKIVKSTKTVLEKSIKQKRNSREVAMELARAKVEGAVKRKKMAD
jgi:hypothetical protein